MRMKKAIKSCTAAMIRRLWLTPINLQFVLLGLGLTFLYLSISLLALTPPLLPLSLTLLPPKLILMLAIPTTSTWFLWLLHLWAALPWVKSPNSYLNSLDEFRSATLDLQSIACCAPTFLSIRFASIAIPLWTLKLPTCPHITSLTDSPANAKPYFYPCFELVHYLIDQTNNFGEN